MKSSRRARRIQRHYSRMHRAGGLNLVSLMDIFTILVFFLMVNSSDVKVLQSTPDVDLPVSTAGQQAVDSLTVQVTADAILVQGRVVAEAEEFLFAGPAIPGLSGELALRRERRGEAPGAGFEVTILAGRDTDYRLLRKVMQSCVDQDYRQVRLAVESPGEVGNG